MEISKYIVERSFEIPSRNEIIHVEKIEVWPLKDGDLHLCKICNFQLHQTLWQTPDTF